MGPCQSYNLSNVTITVDERIVCQNINLQNVTINNGAKLLLQATVSIVIGPNVIVNSGGSLELEGGTVKIDYGTFKVMQGASFKVK